MYICSTFLDKEFIGFEWKSSYHLKFAEDTVLCNPAIRNKDDLIAACEKINNLSQSEISKAILDLSNVRSIGIF